MMFLDIILHPDVFFMHIISGQGFCWFLMLLGLIVMLESGCVFTPFLPGDSLLFSVGMIASLHGSGILQTLLVVFVSAVFGYELNYIFASKIEKMLRRKKWQFKYYRLGVERASIFYARYGFIALIIARFVPIVRTYAAFVAGLIGMPGWSFMLANLFGAALWSGVVVLAGYYFGHFSWVMQNFALLVYGVVLLSIAPVVISIFRNRGVQDCA